MVRSVMEASHAASEAVKLIKPDVVAAYPITPQTQIVERISEMVADGDLKTEYIRVESEFGAISALVGAAAAGSRTYSSTASQGLALMNEMLFVASGMRLPCVMNVANRALSAPISIWNDHQDSMSARDIGWLQFHCETAQECLDLTLLAYKVAEDHKVLTPALVCLDGFTLSHVFEPVDVPDQKTVDAFIPPFKPLHAYVDPARPVTQGPIAFPTHYMELRNVQNEAMLNSFDVLTKAFKEFADKFGRTYDFLELYQMDDAEYAFLGIGSECGTLKVIVDKLRKKGEKVGLIKMIVYRPFPKEQLLEATKDLKGLAVLDKAISVGFEGVLFTEVRSAHYDSDHKPELRNFIVGLGGRDIQYEHVENIYDMLKSGKGKKIEWMY